MVISLNDVDICLLEEDNLISFDELFAITRFSKGKRDLEGGRDRVVRL